jgi:transcriptional regulator with XRE-family HTH domain
MAKQTAIQSKSRRRRPATGAQAPEPVTLARKLQAFRQQRNKFQAEIADALGVTQRVVSRIEGGQRQIQPDELNRFREAYGLELEDVRVARGSTPATPLLLDADEFLDAQQSIVLKDEHPYTLWILNPAELPMLESNAFTLTWARNLQSKFEYRTIWILDLTSAEDLLRFIARVHDVAAVAYSGDEAWSGGAIHIYPLILPRKRADRVPENVSETKVFYEQVQRDLGTSDPHAAALLRLHDITQIDSDQHPDLLHFLMKFYFDPACVVAYKPHSLLKGPRVAIELKDIARHDDHESRRGFCFLGDKATTRFMSYLKHLEAAFPKA